MIPWILFKPQSMTEYDELCRIVLTGSARTGKSSLIERWYVGQPFRESYVATIGVDFKIGGVMEADGRMCKLQLWDTAGQPRFEAITQSYYRGGNIIVLVYSVDNRESFQQLGYYYRRALQQNERAVYVVVGNKTDVPERQVTSDEARHYAESQGMLFAEASARETPQLFRDIIRLAVLKWVATVERRPPRDRPIPEQPRPPERLFEKRVECWEITPIFILGLVLVLVAARLI